MSSGALREVAAVFGFVWDDRAVVAGRARLEATTQQVSVLSETVGGQIVTRLAEFANEMMEVGSALNDASDNLGVTTDQLQQLQFAFGQAGVRGQQVNNALSGLSVRMEDAASGAGKAGAAFNRLHVNFRDAHGQMRPVSELMPEIAHGMSGITNPAERVRLSMALFGGVGRRLVGVLHDGEGGIADMRHELALLGGGMSTEAVHAADAYGDSLSSLQTAMLSVKSTIAVWLLPKLAAITTWIAHAVGSFSILVRNSRIVEVAFVALGATVLATTAPMLVELALLAAPFLLMAAAVAAATLVIEDLWTAFNGGDSVTSRIANQVGGLNTMRDALQGIKVAWLDIQNAAEDAFDTFVSASAAYQNAVPHLTESGRQNALATAAENRTRQAAAAQRHAAYAANRASLGAPVVQSEASIESHLEDVRRRRAVSFAGGNPYANFQGQAVTEHAGNARKDRAEAAHVTHVTHGPTTIHVVGVGSPEQVATRVARIIEQRAEVARNVGHSQVPRER